MASLGPVPLREITLGAWYRAVYKGEEPAGFVMLYDETLRAAPPAEPQVALSLPLQA